MFSDDRTQVMFDGPGGPVRLPDDRGRTQERVVGCPLPEHHQRARGVRRVRQGQHGDGHAQRVGDPSDREGAGRRRQARRPPVPGHRVRQDRLGPGRRRHRRQQVDQAARGVVELLQPAVHARTSRWRSACTSRSSTRRPATRSWPTPRSSPPSPSSRPTRRRPRASPTCGRRRTTTRRSSTTSSTR